jgi:glycosyltransferase involved in cell wall biosynthesis
MPTAALLSFRLGGTDGVSVIAEIWRRTLDELGFDTVTVAGEGPVDRTVTGLELDPDRPPRAVDVESALADADLVVVENLLTIPVNLAASRCVAEVLRGRAALLHHHDPPWHRARFAHVTELPADDPAWLHVTISRMAAADFALRGIESVAVYNAFDVDEPPGDGAALRVSLGADDGRPLLFHPVRAIERKNVPGALRLAEAVGGRYWLPGPAEEGYEPELERLLAATEVPVVRSPFDEAVRADAYAAADAVLFPSTWEGFGNPPIEAAIHRRPVAVGDYPVAAELRELGFRWLPAGDPEPLRAALRDPEGLADDLAANHRIARRHFSRAGLRATLQELLAREGWLP